MVKKTSLTAKKAIKRFLKTREKKGRSEHTVKWYRSQLWPLVKRFKGIPMERIKSDDLWTYLNEVQAQPSRYQHASQRPEQEGGLSAASIRGRIRALRIFFNWYWAETNRPTNTNPMRAIKAPPADAPQPKAISVGNILKLLAATDTTNMGLRNRAMVAFMAETGCRADGMLSLRLQNLDLEHSRALVNEKGRRARFVLFGSYTRQALTDWLGICPETNGVVFCGLSAKQAGKPLTSSGLHYSLNKLAEKAGIEGPFNPHSFRHGFGVTLSLKGVNQGVISKLMGHSSLSVTADSYGIFTLPQLVDLHSEASPLHDLNLEEERG